MLKKMRWRFIGAAMVAFTAVVFVLLCIINVWNFTSVTRQQDASLQDLLEFEVQQKPPLPDGESPAPNPSEHFSPEVRYMQRYFVVCTDASRNVLEFKHDFIASVSEDDATRYVNQVLQGSRTSGYLEGYRYLVGKTERGNVTIFLNSERELQSMKSLLLITAAVAMCCLLLVFILVAVLSRRAIVPYIRNIETQKRFITDAGHELKTPLTAISTSADVLAMELADNEWVQNIQRQSGRMAKLIADLVTLSRLDEERPFPEMKEFSLSEAVWEIAEPFASLAEAGGKEYAQHIEDNLVLRGEQSAIQQMVGILLDNALKYSDACGKIQLDVRKKQRKTEISVSNTCDLVPEDIQRLFDRFYRSDSARSSRDSYGIGLSIAKAIAENHGGTIRAEAAENSAIRFIVTLS